MLIATTALVVGLLAGGLMAYTPEASADCTNVNGHNSGNSQNVNIVGGNENCD
jgi:hypothetical protein